MGKDSDLTRRDVFALAALGLAAGAPRMVAAAPRKSAVSGHSFDRVGAALFDPKQPLKSDIVQPNNARVSTQIIRQAGGSQAVDVVLRKNALTAGAGGLTLRL